VINRYEISCRYGTKSNISLDKDCARPARTLKMVFLTVPVTNDPIVPKERDPRKD